MTWRAPPSKSRAQVRGKRGIVQGIARYEPYGHELENLFGSAAQHAVNQAIWTLALREDVAEIVTRRLIEVSGKSV